MAIRTHKILSVNLTVLLMTILFHISSQNIMAQHLQLPDLTSYPCGTLSFPVTASNFPTDMGDFTIRIPINTAYLTYVNTTPGVVTGFSAGYSAATGQVTILKSSLTPFNINGVMFTVNFNYIGGSCPVGFNTNPVTGCVFSTIGLTPVYPTYDDGTAGPIPRTNYFVDAARPSSGNGLSWGAAFKTITEAANAALDRGDHVTIKPGTYNEALIIKSNGTELIPVKTGVSITSTNTITFPTGTSLGCIDPASYPDEIFVYVYRSMKGNNGVYELLSVNTSTRTATVKGANFVTETGVVGDTSQLQAAIGHAIVYRKDTTSASPVIVSATGITTAKAVCYVGTPTASGEDVTASANYNIIDGLDLTGISAGATGRYGLRIQGSKYNVFMRGKIYECDSVGIFIGGNNTFTAKRNIISRNTIYNCKQKGLKLGNQGATAANNRVHQNLFLYNEVYSTGSGGNKGFQTMAEAHQNTSHNIIERNTFRNFSFMLLNRAVIDIWNNTTATVVDGNFIKDATDALTGTNAFIYLHSSGTNNRVFNNVLLMSSANNDDIYAFRLNAAGHTGTRVAFNTVYNIDKGVLFEDSGTPVPDFFFKDNILYQINDFYFTHVGTTNRFSVGYNCYGITPTQSGGSLYWPDATSKTGDPLFLNPSFFGSPYGFTVKTGSPCLAGGTPITSLTQDLRFLTRNASTPTIGAFENVLTNTNWTGSYSTDWHDYRNWNPEIVPTNLLQAVIPNRSNDPVITNSNANCKGLDLQSGAQVRVSPFHTLTINN
jgi:hypothetical protein